jgi:hypothetical protein
VGGKSCSVMFWEEREREMTSLYDSKVKKLFSHLVYLCSVPTSYLSYRFLWMLVSKFIGPDLASSSML